ncbi:nucleotidyltransferase family protein [Pseudonocardia nigra]|uniref:nucleotidyltransferase family protein n=1 Tax=Pseudonocardia nigra TaxID=1921578 RepID=UPI001C5F8609|nr:nucleotidyltransferase family protein [Pseudonocardia nigra]
MSRRADFLAAVLQNPINVAILERAPALAVPDWWLTAGAVFQTVWNVLDGRPPGTGIKDYDLFYYDARNLSYEAEDAVIRKAAALFGDLDADVEVRNEARVHLWYEQRFGVPAIAFRSATDAIDHFASTTCCFGLRRERTNELVTYAPHGYDDLFAKRVRPNPRLAPRGVYEAKARRWRGEWPDLVVDPWPEEEGARGSG